MAPISISFESTLLEQFEDIIKDETSSNGPNIDKNELDDYEETVIPTLDANSLTLKDLLHELERRGIHPRGFFADDAKVLQAELDKEHDEYLESKRREKHEARDLEGSQRLLQRRKALTEIAMREEREEMENNERINEWFGLIHRGKTPSYCRIDVNNVSTRSLARLLWSDTRILSLDVSNLNLSDTSGAYLARMLKNNRTIVKLELGENGLGYETCVTMAESLRVNNVLEYLSMESNPLNAKNGTMSIDAMANIVKYNKSVRYLNLWRCNIGVEGGRMIAEAMRFNDCLICMELGYNFWEYSDIEMIKEMLLKNRQSQQTELDKQRALERKENEDMDIIKKQEEQKRMETKNSNYLHEQKLERAEHRRVEMERAEEKKMIEEEEREKELELHRLEEEKKKSKSKKKKKGKKVCK